MNRKHVDIIANFLTLLFFHFISEHHVINTYISSLCAIPLHAENDFVYLQDRLYWKKTGEYIFDSSIN